MEKTIQFKDLPGFQPHGVGKGTYMQKSDGKGNVTWWEVLRVNKKSLRVKSVDKPVFPEKSDYKNGKLDRIIAAVVVIAVIAFLAFYFSHQ